VYCSARGIRASDRVKKMGLRLKPVVRSEICCDKNYYSDR
jgi:hypothetical protein